MKYKPNKCIYCLNTSDLSNEHIIPESLGGKLILQYASCKMHRDITSSIEKSVSREMYWPLRLSLGIKGKKSHKKRRPTHWPIEIFGENIYEKKYISVQELPKFYITFSMPPPGIFTNSPLSNMNPALEINLKADLKQLETFLQSHKAKNFEFKDMIVKWGEFSKLVAKISHAYTVSILGLEGIEFYLPSIIDGKREHISHYIGGTPSKEEDLEENTVLSLDVRLINDAPHIVCKTTIMGGNRFPTYMSVVGKIFNSELVDLHLKKYPITPA